MPRGHREGWRRKRSWHGRLGRLLVALVTVLLAADWVGVVIGDAIAGDRRGGWRNRDRDDDDGRRSWSDQSGGNWSSNSGNSGWGNSGSGGNNSGWSGSTSSSSNGGGSSNYNSTNSNSNSGNNSQASQSRDRDDDRRDDERRDNDRRDNDRRDNDDGQRGASAGSGRSSASGGDDGPPRTVLELFKRAFQSNEPDRPKESVGQGADDKAATRKWQPTVRPELRAGKRDEAPARAAIGTSSPRSAVKAALNPPAAKQGKTASVTRVRLPRSSMPVSPPDPGAVKSNVILGVDLTAASLAKARQLGFVQRSVSDVAIGAVSELQVPQGMDAPSARALLARELPNEAFTYSIRYRISPQGDGKATPSAAYDQPIAGGKVARPCEGDRCYASQMLSWRSHLGTCARQVKIGIIDTAVDLAHPALGRMRWKLGSFGGTSVANEQNWHGTGVTALLAGAPDSLTPGLIPDTEFLIADIFSTGDDGQPESDSLGLMRALRWLEALGVNVVNLSISGGRDEAVEPILKSMAARGVIFVAAAGNDGPHGAPSYPAAYPWVIAVTAVNKELVAYRNATRGDYIDVAAPGVNIWTALPNSRMGYRTGTSFAAPYVTSVIATLYASTPARTKAEMLERLEYKDLGPAGRDPIYGRGLIAAPKGCAPPEAAPTLARAGAGTLKSAASAP